MDWTHCVTADSRVGGSGFVWAYWTLDPQAGAVQSCRAR